MSQISAKKKPTIKVVNFANDEPKILGFSGKLEAGKDSACNFLHALAFTNVLGRMENGNYFPLARSAYVNERGRLVVETSDQGMQEFDIDSREPAVVQFMYENVWPFIKKFSCADYLKSFCVDVLGLKPEQVYGTNEQKNTPTKLLWENMPCEQSQILYINGELANGYMTGREVMEYFGTNIVRKMNPQGWANSLGVMLDNFSCAHKLVKDIRFPNEVDVVHARGGKVIRLTRTTEAAAKNTTKSNTALDDYDGFDAVIDNQGLTMEEMFGKLSEILLNWNWFSFREIEVSQ